MYSYLNAYSSIFEWIPYCIYIILGLTIVSFLIFKSTLIAKSILIASGIWLPSIFYLLYIFIQPSIRFEIFASLLIEICILLLWLILYRDLIKSISRVSVTKIIQYKRFLKLCIYTIITIMVYFLFQPGFGLFSDSSRIDYISDSRLNLYLTYLISILNLLSVPYAAVIISYKQKWDSLVVIYILTYVMYSLIAGSKGGAVFMVLGIVCLIRLPSMSAYFKLLRFPVVMIITILFISILSLSEFSQLTYEEVLMEMGGRVFLVNDARALSIDLSNTLNKNNSSLFQESFRSLTSFLGNPPLNPPLGQLLYSEAFGTTKFLGGNSSVTALIIFYGDGIEKALFISLLFFIAFAIFWASYRSGGHRLSRLALGLGMLILLTQDFLAFQVVFNLLIALTFIFFLRKAALRIAFSSKKSLTFH